MGWGNGGLILHDVWGQIREEIPEQKREEVLRRLMVVFQHHDADLETAMDDAWPESFAAFRSLYPFEDEE